METVDPEATVLAALESGAADPYTAAVATAVAQERERVTRLFLDLAADFEGAAHDVHEGRHPGVRDTARAQAYDDVVREMRDLALELGVTA